MGITYFSSPGIVRGLQTQDVDSVLHVQAVCYGDAFLENREVIEQRLHCPFHCSLGVESEGALQAYLVAYWSAVGKITPLNGTFTSPNAGEAALYLHDMSVLPALAGQGIAHRLMHQVFDLARQRGIRKAALVSVQNSQPYWIRQGFSKTDVIDAQQYLHLQTYGDGAVYMTKLL